MGKLSAHWHVASQIAGPHYNTVTHDLGSGWFDPQATYETGACLFSISACWDFSLPTAGTNELIQRSCQLSHYGGAARRIAANPAPAAPAVPTRLLQYKQHQQLYSRTAPVPPARFSPSTSFD